MNRIIVSVVVPLFNKENTIERALQSVLEQTFSDFEILVIDDGSTDSSADRARSFGDRRIAVVGQDNSGPGAARNRGAYLAKGQFLAFLDGDDEWTPGYLEAAVRALNANPTAVAYVCGYDAGEYAKQRPNVVAALGLRGLRKPPEGMSEDNLKKLIDAMHSSSVVVTATAFNTTGGYFAGRQHRYGEDSWLWGQILFAGELYWDDRALTLFHVADSDLGFSIQKRTVARPITLFSAEFKAGFPQNYQNEAEKIVHRYARHDYGILKSSGAWRAAREVRLRHGVGNSFAPLREWISMIRLQLQQAWSSDVQRRRKAL